MKKAAVLFFLMIVNFFCWAQNERIVLPKPIRSGGMPLMDALDRRASARDFKDSAFSHQQVSNVLWAAFGFNRVAANKRTAPTAMNCQEFDLFWVDRNCIAHYLPDSNALEIIAKGDYREAMGKQGFVKNASGVIVFVADYSKMKKMSEEEKDFYSAADCGYISQNVYLFAASEGLSTVVLGWIDREAMQDVLKLRPEQKIIFSQPIGFPNL